MIAPLARSGTDTIARSPDRRTRWRTSSVTVIAGSSSTSAVETVRPSATARPASPCPGGTRRSGWKCSRATPPRATARSESPASRRKSIGDSTARSEATLAMIRSATAVTSRLSVSVRASWASVSASRRRRSASAKSRAFSMVTAAWSAKAAATVQSAASSDQPAAPATKRPPIARSFTRRGNAIPARYGARSIAARSSGVRVTRSSARMSAA
jgi:hypothetical protein